MLSYHYVHEEGNCRILRIINIMLLAYLLPLWMQLLYMGEASGNAGERIVIWNETICLVTCQLLAENLMMVLYVLIMEIVQERIHNLWIYIVVHGTAMTVMWNILPRSDGRIPRLIISILLLCGAVYARIHETHLGYPAIGFLSIGILMVMCAGQVHSCDLQLMGCAAETVFAMLLMVYGNFRSINYAIQNARNAGMSPGRKIQVTNLCMMVLWGIITAGITVLLLLSGAANALADFLIGLSRLLLQQIVRFMMFLYSLLPDPEQAYQRTSSLAEQFELGNPDAAMSILMILLMAVWETLLAFYRIAAFVMAGYCVIEIAKWFYRAFMMAQLEHHENIKATIPVDRIVREMAHGRYGVLPVDPSPSAIIRRSYVRFIRNSDAIGLIQPHMTSEEELTELVNSLKLKDNCAADGSNRVEEILSHIETIRSLYEQARYVPERCRYTDVRNMKRAIREISRCRH